MTGGAIIVSGVQLARPPEIGVEVGVTQFVNRGSTAGGPPARVPVISTETVHDAVVVPAAPSVTPERLMLVDPAAIAGVNVPPQVLTKFGGDATTIAAGSGSLNPAPTICVAFGLLKVMVMRATPFNGMLL